jgi:hypothetical protein
VPALKTADKKLGNRRILQKKIPLNITYWDQLVRGEKGLAAVPNTSLAELIISNAITLNSVQRNTGLRQESSSNYGPIR